MEVDHYFLSIQSRSTETGFEKSTLSFSCLKTVAKKPDTRILHAVGELKDSTDSTNRSFME